ncbi:MAG TPA: ABC transporter ATP-binding protein, partial [Acinetobacter sp.]|nr:ABC transporter ATP-binding protein [Acinetobacter sp.]
MPQPIISARKVTQNIQIHQQNLTILKDIDLEIAQGEQIAITGRSGSGKSTLLGILATLDQASSGELMVCGQAVHSLSEEQRAKVRLENIGFVFQFHHLLQEFTALENVCIPAFIAGKKSAEAESKAKELLEYLGLSQRIHHKPGQMSGGESQRVAVARALINNPAVVFAD